MASILSDETRPNFNIKKSWQDAIKIYQIKNNGTLRSYYVKAIKNQMIRDGIFIEDDKNI